MRNKLFYSVIKHDIYNGIISKWRFYLLATFFFSFEMLLFLKKISNLLKTSKPNEKLSILDFVLYTFAGNEKFDPKKGIDLSETWFIFFIFIFLIVGFYCNEDLKKNGSSIIFITKYIFVWWTGKCIWCILANVIYFLVYVSNAIFYSYFFGDCRWNLSPTICKEFFKINIIGMDIFSKIFYLLIILLLISIAISLVQITLCLFINPIYSFIFVVSYILSSAFYSNAFLLLNYTMFRRAIKMQINLCIISALILLVITYLVGTLRIKKINVI